MVQVLTFNLSFPVNWYKFNGNDSRGKKKWFSMLFFRIIFLFVFFWLLFVDPLSQWIQQHQGQNNEPIWAALSLWPYCLIWHTCPVFALYAPGMIWASRLQKSPKLGQRRNIYQQDFRHLLSNSLFLLPSTSSWGVEQPVWAEELGHRGSQYNEGGKEAEGFWQCGTIVYHNY